MRRLLASVLSLTILGAASGCGVIGGDKLEITAQFSEVSGLYVGNDVGVLGMKVGRITKIEPKGEVVEVTLEISDSDVSIPADAAAVVVSRSVATDRYVELTPVHTGGPVMASGTTIPVERTRTPVDFDRVLGSISDLAAGLTDNPRAANGLREVLQVTAAAFSGNGEKLQQAVHGLSGMVDTVHGQRENIFATMESLDDLTGGLVKDEDLVRAFVRNLDSALELLTSERQHMSGALTTLSRTVDRITRFSKDNRGSVKASVAEVQALMEQLLRSRRDLAEALEVLPLATRNVANAGTPGGNIWVRFLPAQLTPLGPVFEQVCGALGPVCNLVTFPDLSPLTDLLQGGGQ